jgi:hypothetical protein
VVLARPLQVVAASPAAATPAPAAVRPAGVVLASPAQAMTGLAAGAATVRVVVAV